MSTHVHYHSSEEDVVLIEVTQLSCKDLPAPWVQLSFGDLTIFPSEQQVVDLHAKLGAYLSALVAPVPVPVVELAEQSACEVQHVGL